MEYTGLLKIKCDVRRSEPGADRQWVRAGYVLETVSSYPRKMYVEVTSEERILLFDALIGKLVTIHFDIDAREYNGRWFNSITSWAIKLYQGKREGSQQTAAGAQAQEGTQPAAEAPAQAGAQATADDLPY